MFRLLREQRQHESKTTMALPRVVTEEHRRDIEYIAAKLKRKVVDRRQIGAAIFSPLATGDQETEFINEIQWQICDIEKKLESLKVTPVPTTGTA